MQRRPGGMRSISRDWATASSWSGWRRMAVPLASSSRTHAASSRRSIRIGAVLVCADDAWIASAVSVRPLPGGPVMVTPARVGAIRRTRSRSRCIAALSPSNRAGSVLMIERGVPVLTVAPRAMAPSTLAISSALRHGFIMKSLAPACIAVTAIRMPLCAVMITTRAFGSSAMMRARQAIPSAPLDSPTLKFMSSRMAS